MRRQETYFACVLIVLNLYFCNVSSEYVRQDDSADNRIDRCDVDPDAFLSPTQIIRRHGYPAESHVVETEDGYLLTIHRIPGGRDGIKGSQPVFIQHGLLSSSADFVDTNNRSLGFILADLGYDVWLGNARGNTYSKAHVSLLNCDPRFWNFSWHEMGKYDVPATLEFISNTTGKAGDIIYIGHSMGTTMYFVFASLMPELAAKHLKAFIGMAPVTFLKDIKSPIKYIAPFVGEIEWVRKHMGFNEFLPSSKLLALLAFQCEKLTDKKDICENVIFALCGFDRSQFDPKQLPVILNNAPAGSSTKTLIHYAQIIDEPTNFKMFDYHDKNMEIYGTPDPPSYNISLIKTPALLMFGLNDWLATPSNVLRLASRLSNKPDTYQIPYEKFNHVDFLWAKDAPALVYKPLVKYMRKYA